MAAEIVKKRWLRFLIWQSICSTVVFIIYRIILFSLTQNTYFPSLLGFLSFLVFHLSMILFAFSVFLIYSSHDERSASIPELIAVFFEFLLYSISGGSPASSDLNIRRRAQTSLGFLIFVTICGLSGFLATIAACAKHEGLDGMDLMEFGFRGLVFGIVYGVHYVYKKRWILKFPIIQRPIFFSFKMVLPSSLTQALKLPGLALLLSTPMVAFFPNQSKGRFTIRLFIIKQIIFCVGASATALCWELSHHLIQVLHTRRYIFAPSQGSAAAETNPTEPLLEALEQSKPKSICQYLAYLDLCMIAESSVDSWRRAAFFEETGETYRRIISACLRPLEQLTSQLDEGLGGLSSDKSAALSQQLCPPDDMHMKPKIHEVFDDFQRCAWCARTIAALTTLSHQEDRFGVAQLTGSNANIISTLLSCLLAVETCLGKKTNLQPSRLMGPPNIKWATMSTGRRDGDMGFSSKKRASTLLHQKAYAMADILRTSVYEIVSVFQDEMRTSAKSSILERDWIRKDKPIYGTKEILVQKLSLFLEFRAC